MALNGIGGVLVLASYAYCFAAYPGPVADFWGGVPEALRPLYGVSMVLAAAGYFAFAFFLLCRWHTARTGGRIGRGAFDALFALILIPSALWMPLTFAMLESPSAALWWAIRVVLFAVGIGSLGLLAGLIWVRPLEPTLAHRLAVAGAAAFSFQTAILDALVWPAFFGA
jgi:hypothetical protein